MAFIPSLDAAGAREAAIVNWTDPTIQTRYPNARDGSERPAEGFFDSQAHAQAAITARGALIGVERRRFTVPVADIVWIDPTTGIPAFTLTDAEQAVDGTFMLSRFEIDLDAETTSLELFG